MAISFLYRAAFANIRVYSPIKGDTMRFDIGAMRSKNGNYLPWFTDLSIRIGLSTASEIRVNLNPPNFDEFKRILDEPWLMLGNTLSVQWGYTDHPSHVSDWHHAMMQKPDISINENFSITLIGQGFAWGSKRDSTKRVWASEEKPMSRFAVLQEIAKAYGMPIVIEGIEHPTRDKLKEKGFPEDLLKAIFDDVKNLVQAGINDWAFLRKEFNNLGLWMWNDKFFRVALYKGSYPPKPKTVFVAYGPGNSTKWPDSTIMPMWNYNAGQAALFLPSRGVAFDAFGPDADRQAKQAPTTNDMTPKGATGGNDPKKPNRGMATGGSSSQASVTGNKDAKALPGTTKASPDAGVRPTVDKSGGATASEWIPTASSQDIGETLVQARRDKSVADYGVQVEFDSLDDPTLAPGDLIRTENLGTYFSGNHRVIEIEHKIGSDFGMMSIKAAQLGWKQSTEMPEMIDDAGKPKQDDPEGAGTTNKSPDKNAGA